MENDLEDTGPVELPQYPRAMMKLFNLAYQQAYNNELEAPINGVDPFHSEGRGSILICVIYTPIYIYRCVYKVWHSVY